MTALATDDRGQLNGRADAAIAVLAMDQRGSLLRDLRASAPNRAIEGKDLELFKALVVAELSQYATGVLLDPEYGLSAAKCREAGSDLILAYEKSGYDPVQPGRLPALLPAWSVRRLVERGADAVKLLVYFDP